MDNNDSIMDQLKRMAGLDLDKPPPPTLTSFMLRPGLSIIAGQVGSGKTEMLINLAEEGVSAGSAVYWVSEEIYSDPRVVVLNPSVMKLMSVSEVMAYLENAAEGDLFLVDDLSLQSTDYNTPKTSAIKALTDVLDHYAKIHKCYVVGTLQLRRTFSRGEFAVSTPLEEERRYPVYKLKGKRR